MFHAQALEMTCTACNHGFYAVELNLIANPAVSYEWTNKYVWLNEQMEELEGPFIVTLKEKTEGVPHRWQLYQVEAPSGRLDRHLFGPFSTVKYFGPFLEIEYLDDDSKTGVASCHSSAIWTKAAALIGRIWPILTGTTARSAENAAPMQ